MHWADEQKSQFNALLKRIMGDAAIVDEGGVHFVEVRSPQDLDNDTALQFAKSCPYTVRIVVGPLHLTESRLDIIAEKFGLSVGSITSEGRIEIRFNMDQPPDAHPAILIGLVIGALVSDTYIKVASIMVNDQPMTDDIDIAGIRDGVEAVLRKFANELKAKEEFERNQATGGLTDENIKRISEINTVDDLLNM